MRAKNLLTPAVILLAAGCFFCVLGVATDREDIARPGFAMLLVALLLGVIGIYFRMQGWD